MITDYKKAIENIRWILGNYIKTHKIQSLVLGVSGGIDSALCAVLAKPVCDDLEIPLIGRSITIESNKEDEINRARKIGKFFCTKFKELDLTSDYNDLIKSIAIDEPSILEDTTEAKIRKGNVKARMRMIRLYDLAGAYKGMVLSTDNYTEYLCGFWTLAGDIGNFGCIGNLWKTEVYEIAKYIYKNSLKNAEKIKALKSCINATPTDGLGITNSDLDQLGASSYHEVDSIIKQYLDGDRSIENHIIIQRHKRTEYKRNDPYNIPRKLLF